MEACSSIPNSLWTSASFGAIRSNCRAATLHRISTAIHEPQLALGRPGASRCLTRTESSHGLAVRAISWLAGKAPLGSNERLGPDCPRTRRRDHACNSCPALRAAFSPHEYSDVDIFHYSVHASHL